jgi:AraC family transcriptional regulator
MQVDIISLPQQRVASVRHLGPYNQISEAFGRLGAIAGPAGLFGPPGARMIAIYHDDPEAVAPAELRSDAGVVVTDDKAIPPALVEIRIPAGRYARTLHVGPYDELGDVWSRFMGGWLVENGHRVGHGPCYELYLDDPTQTAPEALRTELYCPIA